jgi:hypothetical protein
MTKNDFIRCISGLQRKDNVSVSNLWKQIHMKFVEDSSFIKTLMWLARLTRMDAKRLVS